MHSSYWAKGTPVQDGERAETTRAHHPLRGHLTIAVNSMRGNRR